MDKKEIKLYNLVYDTVYNLRWIGRNGRVLNAKIDLFLNDMEKEVLSFGYEFKLNDKTQKFRLLK